MSDFPPEPGQPEPSDNEPFEGFRKKQREAVDFSVKVRAILDGELKPTPDVILGLLDQAEELKT